ncbi:MAG: CocE/NonD family hydrolase, partial [Methanobacteriota archaeon]
PAVEQGFAGSVLVVHGFTDASVRMGGVVPWARTLSERGVPVKMLLGQWDHDMPDEAIVSSVSESDREAFAASARWDWAEILLRWFDYWLKGVGSPPRLGLVDYQDDGGAWRESSAWPPADARLEALYVDGTRLAAGPGSSSSTIVDVVTPGGERCTSISGNCNWPLPSKPSTGNGTVDNATRIPRQPPYDPTAALCTGAGATSVVATTAPVKSGTTVAGNPFAFLDLTSTAPGGTLTVNVFDLAPDFRCAGPTATGARWLRYGAADLRFLHGNYVAEPFPVNTPTPVRIDVASLATHLEAGHRLAVTISAGDPLGRQPQGYAPVLAIGPQSHLVLPLVEGTLGGDTPTASYPPRPFEPEAGP